MQTIMGDFPWATFAKASGLTKQKEFVVRQPSYLEALGKLLTEVRFGNVEKLLASTGDRRLLEQPDRGVGITSLPISLHRYQRSHRAGANVEAWCQCHQQCAR